MNQHINPKSLIITPLVLILFASAEAFGADFYVSAGELIQPCVDQAAPGDTCHVAGRH